MVNSLLLGVTTRATVTTRQPFKQGVYVTPGSLEHIKGLLDDVPDDKTDATRQRALDMAQLLRDAASFQEDSPVAEDKLERLNQGVKTLYEMTELKEKLAKALADHSKTMEYYASKVLVDLLDEAEVDRVGLPEHDLDAVLENFCRATLPKDPDAREAAISWLDNNGHGSMVRLSIGFSLPSGPNEYKEALALKAKLEKEYDTEVSVDTNVPWNTLTAFVKEQLRKGAVIPLETLGAYVGRVVKLKKRK